MAARAAARCTNCGDVVWFRVQDLGHQSGVCKCGETTLTEGGYFGPGEDLTAEEMAELED
ncbi:hypothetical protein [[Eubacterium] cellulosolvens]